MMLSKPFDATTRDLLEMQPLDWLRYAGLEAEDVEVINSDLSTITTEADKIIRVNRPWPYIGHVELQASYKADVPSRALRYNVLGTYRHQLPVVSIVVLLRREADGPAMTGELEYTFGSEEPYLRFRYRVVRAWEKPVEEVLAGGLGTLPMAPLSDVRPEDLQSVIRRMEGRISQEATEKEAAQLWTATYVLMGLRYSSQLAAKLLEGVRAMEESVTYQAILTKGWNGGKAEGLVKGKAEGIAAGAALGAAAEAKSLLLRIGSKRFGPPDAATRSAIEGVYSVEQLEVLVERVLDVSGWTDLFTGLS